MHKLFFIIFIIISPLKIFSEVKETKLPNPNIAAFLSVLPAGGQIYNKSYYRAIITVGIESSLGYSVFYWNDKCNKYKKKMNNEENSHLLPIYKEKYDDAKEKRLSMQWWLGITILASMLDAYVDANLKNFYTEKKKLQFYIENNSVGISYKF